MPARRSAGEADAGVASFVQTDDVVPATAVPESTVNATPEPHEADSSPPSPAVGPGPVEPAMRSEPGKDAIATKPEARKRGRPRKLEDEAKAEKTEARPEAGRRQKSLFDF